MREAAGASRDAERRHDAASTRRPRRSTCGPAATSPSTSSRSDSTRHATTRRPRWRPLRRCREPPTPEPTPSSRLIAFGLAEPDRRSRRQPNGPPRAAAGVRPRQRGSYRTADRRPRGRQRPVSRFVRAWGRRPRRPAAAQGVPAFNVVGLTVATAWPDLRGSLSRWHFRSLGLPAAGSRIAVWPSPSG